MKHVARRVRIAAALATLFLLILIAGPGQGPRSAQPALPDPVQAVLEKSCMNCHSDSWFVPYPARIWPVSLYFEHTVEQARKRVDFSEWSNLSLEKQAVRKRKIAKALRGEYMPPIEYTLFHPFARLTEEDRTILLEWAKH